MDQITSISFIVLAVALALPLATRLGTGHPKLLRFLKHVVLAVYLLANLSETLLFREVSPQANYELDLLWSYKQALALDGGLLGFLRSLCGNGLQALGGAHITDRGLFKEIILNILLYVPMGYLLPFTWPSLARRRKAATTPESLVKQASLLGRIPWRVVGLGLCASVATELTQLIFHLGLFEFDDILNNTFGCLLGVILYLWVMRNQKNAERSSY
ncbi:MAG: VanZ family protein [Clostridia bacterium]